MSRVLIIFLTSALCLALFTFLNQRNSDTEILPNNPKDMKQETVEADDPYIAANTKNSANTEPKELNTESEIVDTTQSTLENEENIDPWIPQVPLKRVVPRELPENLSSVYEELKLKALNGDIDSAVILGRALLKCASKYLANDDSFDETGAMCKGVSEESAKESNRFLKMAAKAGDPEGMGAFLFSDPYDIDGFWEAVRDGTDFTKDQLSEWREHAKDQISISTELMLDGNVSGAQWLSQYYYSDFHSLEDGNHGVKALRFSLIYKYLTGSKATQFFIDELESSLPLYEIEEAHDYAKSFQESKLSGLELSSF